MSLKLITVSKLSKKVKACQLRLFQKKKKKKKKTLNIYALTVTYTMSLLLKDQKSEV